MKMQCQGSCEPGLPGLIHVKATLILVPTRLVIQWYDEVKRFMAKGTNVFKVLAKNAWQKLTIRQIKEADIIIVAFSTLERDHVAKHPQ